MHGPCYPYLAFLLIAALLFSSYAGISLASRFGYMDTPSWNWWYCLSGGSLAMGGIGPLLTYRSTPFLLSLCFAASITWLTLWIALALHDNRRALLLKRIGVALTMVVAISGMHYIRLTKPASPDGFISFLSKSSDQMWLLVLISIACLSGLAITLRLLFLVTRIDVLRHRSTLFLEETNSRLQVLATIDTLTGLPNRSFFMHQVEDKIKQSGDAEIPFGIIFIDLDGFKTINDSLGHPVGDDFLRLFSLDLKKCIRSNDVVARLGGDEFAVLLSGIGGRTEIEEIASAILKRMEVDFVVNLMPLRVTASLGIAIYPADGTTVSSLLKNADVAMYDAKQHGKNSYRFVTASLRESAGRIPLIYRSLGEALEQKQFSLVFQPKFGGVDNHMVGAEALIRWIHPALGNIPPMDFIPIAEQTGQIVQISEWVICEVCRRIKEWDKAGLHTIKIAINLSAEELRLTDYAKRIALMVNAAGVAPERIMFEITETAAMREPDTAAEIIRDFQRAGFDIAIDDFGAGYSSMSYLQRFRVRELKIDRFFIRALDEDSQEGQTIIAAIITLAHSLNMKVVAEGVETLSQLEKLSHLRCDEVQGYLLAKPLCLTDFEDLLLQHKDKGDSESRTMNRGDRILPSDQLQMITP